MTDARGVSKALRDLIERSVRRLELRFYQAVTSASPVDTGFFRAGWSPSKGRRRPGPADPPRQEEAARALAGTLFAQHSRRASQIAESYVLADGPVFIVNNVRYGVFLNRGSSAQAPAMFVEMALAQAVRATQAELARSA